MYITYEEYTSYGGTLDETTFNQVYFQAKSFVDWVTFNRLQKEETFSEEVKRCMFDLISLLYNKQLALTPSDVTSTTSSTGSAGITEMSNDGVEVKFTVLSSDELLTHLRSEIASTINRYLGASYNSLGKKLTYRGIYPDE